MIKFQTNVKTIIVITTLNTMILLDCPNPHFYESQCIFKQ